LPCAQNIFFKFSSEVLFNIGLFYPQNFSEVNNVSFISNVTGRRSTQYGLFRNSSR